MTSTEFALIRIPDDLSFEDLNLTVDPANGSIKFDWAPLREIMEVNAELSLSSDEEAVVLIGAWYSYLRLNGYRHDVAERHLAASDAMKEFGYDRVFAGPDTTH